MGLRHGAVCRSFSSAIICRMFLKLLTAFMSIGWESGYV